MVGMVRWPSNWAASGDTIMKPKDFFLNKRGTLCMYLGCMDRYHGYVVVMTRKVYYTDASVLNFKVLSDAEVVDYLRNV
jgi:hypothetical protein